MGEPIVVSGSINHVNHMGNTWILSDIGVSAKEVITSSNGGKQWKERQRTGGDIVSLELSNLEDTSIQKRRGCSYFIHDPDQHGVNTPWRFRTGERVSFRLKLS